MKLTKLIYPSLLITCLIGYGNLDTLANTDNQAELSHDKNASIQPSGDIPDSVNGNAIPSNLQKQAAIARKRGIPESVTIAIAAHETGWFRAVIGEGNYFGVKCISSDKDPCTSTLTTESYCTGLCSQSFQVGKNPEFMAQVFSNTLINLGGLEGKSPDEVYSAFTGDFANTMNTVGRRYATDGQWSSKVMAVHELVAKAE